MLNYVGRAQVNDDAAEVERMLEPLVGQGADAGPALVSRFRSSWRAARIDLEGAEAEAVDGGKDVVGGFGPAEGLLLGVVGVDVGVDVGFEGVGRAMDA